MSSYTSVYDGLNLNWSLTALKSYYNNFVCSWLFTLSPSKNSRSLGGISFVAS